MRRAVALACSSAARCRRLSSAVSRRGVEAHLRQIEAVNPRVNAIVTLVPERAVAEAAADWMFQTGAGGLLHGIADRGQRPVDTAGIRTTYGSPIYAHHVPATDALIVDDSGSRRGDIGKTNTPEFGAGSHTFNAVFAPTRNPYDLGASAGGSSGGAAAPWRGIFPIADGSDLGGSLRNPPRSAMSSACGRAGPRRLECVLGDAWNPMSV